MDFTVVFYETELPEFIHEKINPGPRCANHFREHLLRYFGKHLLRLAWRAIAREQQQGARQPFLAGVKELVYKVRLDSNVSREHVGDEAVRELVLCVEQANHLVFLNHEYGGRRNRSRHANGLARNAPFSKKIARSKHRHNGFFTDLIDHSELHAAFLNVHDRLGGITLREDGFFS
jgi:hypothetical protein